MSNTYTIEELINGYYDQEFSRAPPHKSHRLENVNE